MNRATPKMRDFAERLITYEAAQTKTSATSTASAFEVTEKLRPHLATLMGNAGFRALLMRALALAGAEVLWLREVQVSPTSSLTLPQETAEKVTAKDLLKGRVILLAQLLGLMVAFIGESLTLQLVLDVWPQFPINDLNTTKEDPT